MGPPGYFRWQKARIHLSVSFKGKKFRFAYEIITSNL